MEIRKATNEDLEKVFEIARDLEEWFTKEALKNMEVDFEMNNNVVILDKDEIIGFMCYTSIEGCMKIIWMGIKRDKQRKKAGQKLLEWLEFKARELGLHLLEVETLPEEIENKPYEATRNFYYKNGFKRIHYKKSNILGWDDQIVLQKKL